MMAVSLLLLLGACLAPASSARDAQQSRGAAGAIRLEDLDGRPVTVLPGGAGSATVFVFVSTDCPIANRYAPELSRIHERFAGQARFWLVYPDPAESPQAVRDHARAFGFGFAALRDPRHELVRATGATATPEAAVFVPSPEGPRLVYRGRIDDRNVDFGRTRPAPSTHDLEDALSAIGAGSAGPLRTTPVVGCAIPPLR